MRRREVTRPSSPYIYIFGLGLQHSPHGTQDGTQGDKPDDRRDFFFYSHLIPPISFQILRPEEQLRSKMGQCLSASKPIIEALLTELAKPAPGAHHHQQQQQQQQTASGPVAGGQSGAVHPSLPAGAEKHRVRNVYDGDTLTLTDERRIRLLGIDTPEIKDKQPFAQEAKAYTKALCDKKDVWISFDPGGDKADHYGRLLCFIFVPAEDGSGYLCVNEGIIAAGYAGAYHPGKGKHLHNWNKLVALQSQARKDKCGMWSTFQDILVVKTANGSAYHKRSCEHLSSVRNLTEMRASVATEKGLHPCRSCFS